MQTVQSRGVFKIKTQGDSPPCIVARLRGHTRAVLSLDSDPRFQLQQKSLLIFQNHSWILSASADKTVKLWDALQIETGFSTITVLCSSKIFTKGGKSNNIDQQTVGSSLTLTGHFMKVPKSFLHYIFQIIKGAKIIPPLYISNHQRSPLSNCAGLWESPQAGMDASESGVSQRQLAQGFFCTRFFCFYGLFLHKVCFHVNGKFWGRKNLLKKKTLKEHCRILPHRLHLDLLALSKRFSNKKQKIIFSTDNEIQGGWWQGTRTRPCSIIAGNPAPNLLLLTNSILKPSHP